MYFIIGSGGHGRVIADILAAGGHQSAFVTEEELADRYDGSANDVVIIGIGDNATRERVAARLGEHAFGRALHPAATIAAGVEIGAGSVVMAGAVINPGAVIGAHVIINTGATVDHDCVIGDYASLAPRVALGGNVKLGHGVAIGIGACVVHGCAIGEHTVIGAGAAVVESLPAYRVCYGVPAKVMRERAADERYL